MRVMGRMVVILRTNGLLFCPARAHKQRNSTATGFCYLKASEYENNCAHNNLTTRKYSTEAVDPASMSSMDQTPQHWEHSEVLKLSAFIEQMCNPDTTFAAGKRESVASMNRQHRSALNYLRSMEFPPNTYMVSPNMVKQFDMDTERMDAGMLVQLLSVMAHKNVRHEALLECVCKRLKEMSPTGMHHLALIVSALSRLTHLDSELINIVKQNFLNELVNNENSDDNGFNVKFAEIVHAFGRLHLTDQHFWRKVIEWLEAKLKLELCSEDQRDANPLKASQLTKCIHAFALANVDSECTRKVAEQMAQRLEIHSNSARSWLGNLHNLAILQALDSRMVETVLNVEFVKAVKREQKAQKLDQHTILYDIMRLVNISNVAWLELHKLTKPYVTLDKTESKLARQLKFGALDVPSLNTFHLLLRLIAPLNSHSTRPQWHPLTGAVMESRCFVDTKNQKVIPLAKVGRLTAEERKENCKEVAILYFLDTHLTRVFDQKKTTTETAAMNPLGQQAERGEFGERRLLGIHQLVVRHLKALGLHPVVFTEPELCAFGDENGKLNHIRRRILGLSEEWHNNNWASEETKVKENADDGETPKRTRSKLPTQREMPVQTQNAAADVEETTEESTGTMMK